VASVAVDGRRSRLSHATANTLTVSSKSVGLVGLQP
jgi:hypothetical protein